MININACSSRVRILIFYEQEISLALETRSWSAACEGFAESFNQPLYRIWTTDVYEIDAFDVDLDRRLFTARLMWLRQFS